MRVIIVTAVVTAAIAIGLRACDPNEPVAPTDPVVDAGGLVGLMLPPTTTVQPADCADLPPVLRHLEGVPCVSVVVR